MLCKACCAIPLLAARTACELSTNLKYHGSKVSRFRWGARPANSAPCSTGRAPLGLHRRSHTLQLYRKQSTKILHGTPIAHVQYAIHQDAATHVVCVDMCIGLPSSQPTRLQAHTSHIRRRQCPSPSSRLYHSTRAGAQPTPPTPHAPASSRRSAPRRLHGSGGEIGCPSGRRCSRPRCRPWRAPTAT